LNKSEEKVNPHHRKNKKLQEPEALNIQEDKRLSEFQRMAFG